MMMQWALYRENSCPEQNGQASIWWAMHFFDQCVYSYWEVTSAILGAMSVALWMLALLPQVYVNWKRKSTDGLSTPLLMFWLFGDFMNLAGVFILKQQVFQLFLGVYFVFNDFSLVVQYFIYRSSHQSWENCAREHLPLFHGQLDHGYQAAPQTLQPFRSETPRGLSNKLLKHFRNQRVAASTTLVFVTALALFLWSKQDLAIDRNTVGFYMAWGGSISYHISRLPQIWLNHQRKSVEGLSLAMFLIILSANWTYASSVLSVLPVAPPGYLQRSMAFIYGPIMSMVLDTFVLAQFYVYIGRKNTFDQASSRRSSEENSA